MTPSQSAPYSVAASPLPESCPWGAVRPPLLTVEEVRAELNIGRTLVYQLIWSGDLPVVRVRHALRISRVDLDAYLDAHATRPVVS